MKGVKVILILVLLIVSLLIVFTPGAQDEFTISINDSVLFERGNDMYNITFVEYERNLCFNGGCTDVINILLEKNGEGVTEEAIRIHQVSRNRFVSELHFDLTSVDSQLNGNQATLLVGKRSLFSYVYYRS